MQVVPVWGVELSSYALRAVKMELTASGKPRIVAWDIVDFVEEVEDLTDLSRHHVMGRALYHFKSRHKLERSRVFMSVRAYVPSMPRFPEQLGQQETGKQCMHPPDTGIRPDGCVLDPGPGHTREVEEHSVHNNGEKQGPMPALARRAAAQRQCQGTKQQGSDWRR